MGEINPAISSVFVCDSEQKSVVCKIGALYMVLKDFFFCILGRGQAYLPTLFA